SDGYFFSTRLQVNQHWGTPNPVTIRDKEFGAVRLRGFGIYSYHLTDPAVFHQKVAATQAQYGADELEPHLRNVIIGKVSDAFGQSGVAFLDMAGNIDELSTAMRAQVGPLFTDFGLTLDTFQVESLSLPDELQKLLDQRIGMNMVGDMRQYAQFQAAQSMPIAAANPGGGAGIGAGLGAGMAMGKAMADAISGANAASSAPSAAPAPSAETKFCSECGKPIARSSKFCSECGAKQA
ncbi:MAG TPA: SPFH domain-containing protein, partial [Vicinamibacterales bacterium]|nr:SPFH domain-containing protein [Vicinamibacterales bacterium]